RRRPANRALAPRRRGCVVIVAAANRSQAMAGTQLRIQVLRVRVHLIPVVDHFYGAEKAHVCIRRRHPAATHAFLAFWSSRMIDRGDATFGTWVAQNAVEITPPVDELRHSK